jgi:hypothetical protein
MELLIVAAFVVVAIVIIVKRNKAQTAQPEAPYKVEAPAVDNGCRLADEPAVAVVEVVPAGTEASVAAPAPAKKKAPAKKAAAPKAPAKPRAKKAPEA